MIHSRTIDAEMVVDEIASIEFCDTSEDCSMIELFNLGMMIERRSSFIFVCCLVGRERFLISSSIVDRSNRPPCSPSVNLFIGMK